MIDAAKFSDKYTHKYVYADAPIFSHMAELKNKMFTSQEASALCSRDIDTRISEPGLLVLPSKEIMKNTNYGFPANEDRTNTRGAASTDYVKKYLGYDKGYWIKYWLSDLNPGDHGVVFVLDNEGKISYLNNENFLGIRPVAVLDLSKSVWYDAGTVNSNGEVTQPEKKTEEETKDQETPSAEEPSKGGTPAAAGTDLKTSGTTYTVVSDGAVALKKPNAKSTTVNIPATVKINGVTYKITAISANAFKNNKKITKVTIGANVKEIGKKAFYGCTKLTTVDCKSKVLEKIGASAFQGDKKLTKITLKSTLLKKNTVGKNAFKGTSKKLVIKVPAKAKKAYKKFFKTKGNKKVTIK